MLSHCKYMLFKQPPLPNGFTQPKHSIIEHKHRHVIVYQRNIMGTLIYHNMSVSQSCLLSFLCNPYISFQIS